MITVENLMLYGTLAAPYVGCAVVLVRESKRTGKSKRELLQMVAKEFFKKPEKRTRKPGELTLGDDLKAFGKKFSEAMEAKQVRWQIQNRPRHVFTPDLWVALEAIVHDYAYKILPYDLYAEPMGMPAYIYITFTAQKALTADIAQEVTDLLLIAFRHYLAAYGLDFASFAYPYVSGSTIEVYIFYCEYAQEYSAFQQKLEQIRRSSTLPNFGNIEADIQATKQKPVMLGYEAAPWEQAGMKRPVMWDYVRFPHLLITGNTGQGKSVAGAVVVKQLLEKGAKLYICDFKASGEWEHISMKYAERGECGVLVEEFYKAFCAAIERKQPAPYSVVLVFDEFSDYALTMGAKEQKELMAKIGEIAMMGRSFNFHLLFIGQSFSAKVIDTALRDQFSTRIAVGSLGAEAWTMIFPGCERPKEQLAPFHGYAITPGGSLVEVIFPKFKDVDGLRERIRELGREQQLQEQQQQEEE